MVAQRILVPLVGVRIPIGEWYKPRRKSRFFCSPIGMRPPKGSMPRVSQSDSPRQWLFAEQKEPSEASAELTRIGEANQVTSTIPIGEWL